MKIRKYSARVDGHVIKYLDLTYDQYKTQATRDIVRSAIAKEYSVPRHYIRLCECKYPRN